MKRIIDGKLYDTATATLVHSRDSGHSYDDAHFEAMDLYRTESGIFFVDCEGGPLSVFALERGRDRISGREIQPLSEAEAMEWMEHYEVDPDVVALYFAVPDA